MSDGDWGRRDQNLGVIFGAIALLGSVILAGAIGNTLGINSGRDQVSAREHYENAKANNLRACSRREGPAAIQCATKAIEAAQEESDTRQDLYAQQDMSRWAFWLFILTSISVGITAIGVWFVKRTLDATLEAVEDTGKGTDAMVRANEIAEESAVAQMRPYIVFGEMHFTMATNSTQGGVTHDRAIMVRIPVHNIGKSPAVDMGVFVSPPVFQQIGQIPHFNRDIEWRDKQPLPPGGGFLSEEVGIVEPYITAIQSGWAMYLYAKAEYRMASRPKETFITEIAYQVAINGIMHIDGRQEFRYEIKFLPEYSAIT